MKKSLAAKNANLQVFFFSIAEDAGNVGRVPGRRYILPFCSYKSYTPEI